MRLALNRPASMPPRCLAGCGSLGAFGEDFYQEPANYVEADTGQTYDSGYSTDPVMVPAESFDTSNEFYEPPTDYVSNPNTDDGALPGRTVDGGSTSTGPSTSDQFLSYLQQFGKDAAKAALNWGIKEGTKAAKDYVTCLANGGNADRCAGIVQNAAKQGAQTVTRESLKAQIINLNNEIEKVKAALLSATDPQARQILQNNLNILQTQLMSAISQLAQIQNANPQPGDVPNITLWGRTDQNQQWANYLAQQQPQDGWLTKSLVVPVGGIGVGALAGYWYAKKPMHALLGAGVGGVLGYLLTRVVGSSR